MSTKLAEIIFNKKINYYDFYTVFVINDAPYKLYLENYKTFGEKLTEQEFNLLRKVGRKNYKTL